MVQTEIWSFAEFQQVSGVFRRSGIFCWTGFPPILGGLNSPATNLDHFSLFMKPSHSVIERKEIKGYSTSTSLFTGCIQVMVIGLLYFEEKQRVAIMMMMMMMFLLL